MRAASPVGNGRSPIAAVSVLPFDDQQALAWQNQEVLLLSLPVVRRARLAGPDHADGPLRTADQQENWPTHRHKVLWCALWARPLGALPSRRPTMTSTGAPIAPGVKTPDDLERRAALSPGSDADDVSCRKRCPEAAETERNGGHVSAYVKGLDDSQRRWIDAYDAVVPRQRILPGGSGAGPERACSCCWVDRRNRESCDPPDPAVFGSASSTREPCASAT
jgi:hypothetical protein